MRMYGQESFTYCIHHLLRHSSLLLHQHCSHHGRRRSHPRLLHRRQSHAPKLCQHGWYDHQIWESLALCSRMTSSSRLILTQCCSSAELQHRHPGLGYSERSRSHGYDRYHDPSRRSVRRIVRLRVDLSSETDVSHSFFDLAEFFKLLTKRTVVCMPSKATKDASDGDHYGTPGP